LAKIPSTAPIATAPRDGTKVIVLAEKDQHQVEAHWSEPLQGWVDKDRRVLHSVSLWVPSAGRRGLWE
jgi:hypothetical protein